MGFTLRDARTQATLLLQAAEWVKALRAYDAILEKEPLDYESRLKIADMLASVGATDAAQGVYRAVAIHDLRAGHPLAAVIASRALEALGGQTDDILDMMAALYAADSPHLAKFAVRQAPVNVDQEMEPVDLAADEPLIKVVERAARRALDLSVYAGYPEAYHPIPFFSEVPRAELPRVVRAAIVKRYPDAAFVIREGEPGTAFYAVASGEVRVFSTDSLGRTHDIGRLHENALFGEMALLTAQPRAASAVVVGEADLIEVGRDALLVIAGSAPQVAAALDRFARERLLKNLLISSPLFKPFTRQQQMDLIRRFDGHDVSPGTVIIREGEQGAGLFIVLNGEVEVSKRKEGNDVVLARLRAGDVFGEMSLLRNQATTATVRAARQATVLFLAREYFQRLVDALPSIRQYFQELSERRDQDTQKTLLRESIELGEDDIILV